MRLGVGVSFNLGRAVLLSHLLVAGFENCGTFCLTQIISYEACFGWISMSSCLSLFSWCIFCTGFFFNLGWAVLLSHLMVTRFDNCGTLHLTLLKKTGCRRSQENKLKQCSPAKTCVHELESKNCECSLMAKMALLSEEFRQDVREVTRTDCSLMARMALSSEGFRQDVREANENRLQSGVRLSRSHFCRKCSDRMSEKSQEQTAV